MLSLSISGLATELAKNGIIRAIRVAHSMIDQVAHPFKNGLEIWSRGCIADKATHTPEDTYKLPWIFFVSGTAYSVLKASSLSSSSEMQLEYKDCFAIMGYSCKLPAKQPSNPHQEFVSSRHTGILICIEF